ncbi:MAG: M23 family metallopeptidase [Rhodococcus sp. (in: high G+C Gram-positive bacteria)]|uniref:M23 family metallopeptidase n=1 Tax=Rhodococcus sp. TaxID=1831 RepID=UPI003BB54D1B
MRLVPAVVASITTALAVAACTTAACTATAHGASPDYDWPLQPRPSVTRTFDPPEHDWLPGHRGVDLAGTVGQVVRSAADGTVVFAGIVGGKPVVSIDHDGGLRTTYEPVAASVAPGRRISRGDPIGTLEPGHDGCPLAACLHWGLRRDRNHYLDPLPLVRPTIIRLEPV